MKFGETYFKTLNYTDYLSRHDRYVKHAFELHELLLKLHLIKKTSEILDYGCAVGFLMEGFRDLGYTNIYGYDISQWATLKARNKGLNILSEVKERFFNIIVCLDVLEHMSDREIKSVFSKYKSDIMIVRIPCSLDGKQFVLDVSNRDKTHINLKTKEQWVNLLLSLGYNTVLPLNLLTIYDTPGVMCALCLKHNTQFFK